MENIEKYTNNLEEKIYYSTDTSNQLDTQNQLLSYFKELIKRKRDDIEEEGLQGSIIILPHKFAAKISEENGKGTHQNNNVNLVRYLNNEDTYISKIGMQYPAIYKEEIKQIIKEGIEIRIIATEETLKLAIISSDNIKTIYQAKALKNIISICQKLMKEKAIPNIEIGLSTPTTKIDFDDWNNERAEMFNNAIEQEEEKINKSI